MTQGQDIYLKRIYPDGKTEKFHARVWDKNLFFNTQINSARDDKENPHTLVMIEKSEFTKGKTK